MPLQDFTAGVDGLYLIPPILASDDAHPCFLTTSSLEIEQNFFN